MNRKQLKQVGKMIKKHPNLADNRLKQKYDMYENVMKHIKPYLKELANEYLEDFIAATIMVLRDDLDFGAKRIERFLEKVMFHAKCLQDGNLTRDDIYDTIKQETKFDFLEMIRKEVEKREFRAIRAEN